MRTTALVSFALAAVFAAAPLHAQKPSAPDPLLDELVGQWVMQGTIGGQKTTHDVTAEWVLEHEYVQIREVSRERDPKGLPVYDAIVYVERDPTSGGYNVLWLDNTAAAPFAPVGHAAGAAADSIPFVIESPDQSKVHTTFAYDRATDTWRWSIDNDERGFVTEFARLTLKRAGR